MPNGGGRVEKNLTKGEGNLTTTLDRNYSHQKSIGQETHSVDREKKSWGGYLAKEKTHSKIKQISGGRMAVT